MRVDWQATVLDGSILGLEPCTNGGVEDQTVVALAA